MTLETTVSRIHQRRASDAARVINDRAARERRNNIRAELDWSAFNRALYAMARVEGEV